jgi:hypothetical protein
MEVIITLPDELVERARAAGLLTDARLAAWLEETLKKEFALTRFGDIADALVEGGMTQEELESEFEARKQERIH